MLSNKIVFSSLDCQKKDRLRDTLCDLADEQTCIWSVGKRLDIMGSPSICHHIYPHTH